MNIKNVNEVEVTMSADEIKSILIAHIEANVPNVTNVKTIEFPMGLSNVIATCNSTPSEITCSADASKWATIYGKKEPIQTSLFPENARMQLKAVPLFKEFSYLNRRYITEGHVGDKVICRQIDSDKKHRYSGNLYVTVFK